MQTHFVPIAGGTGSGKTTLARAVAAQIQAPIISIDDYYRPLDHMTFEEREKVNFDCPDAIDHDLLISHLQTLLEGRPIELPQYDFSRHTRAPRQEHLEPAPVVLIEGIFALCWAELNELCPIRVYVETPKLLRFQRRLERDVSERGRSIEEVTHRFHSHVNPMHELYVEPTKHSSTLIVSGIDPIEETSAHVLRHIQTVWREAGTLVGV